MRRPNPSSAALWTMCAVLMASPACTEDNPAYQTGPDLPEECRAGEEVVETFEVFERPEKIDLWFVVYDAGSMDAYQQGLAEAADSFFRRLEQRAYDVRVAVSTMDADADGVVAAPVDDVEGCADNSVQVAKSNQGGWRQAAICNLQQGVQGSSRPRPLDRIDEAVVDEPDEFLDFRRDDARLVTVAIANQDDCSGDDFSDDPSHPSRNVCAWQSDQLRDVDTWAESIRDTAITPQGVSLAVVSGPPAEVEYEQGETVRSVCQSTFGSSYPSPRLFEATSEFGDRGLFLSSCVFDFFAHLETIEQKLIARDSVTLCASEVMAHEPLEVVGVGDDGAVDALDPESGFVFSGSAAECPEGGVELQREASRSLDRLEMTYCAL